MYFDNFLPDAGNCAERTVSVTALSLKTDRHSDCLSHAYATLYNILCIHGQFPLAALKNLRYKGLRGYGRIGYGRFITYPREVRVTILHGSHTNRIRNLKT